MNEGVRSSAASRVTAVVDSSGGDAVLVRTVRLGQERLGLLSDDALPELVDHADDVALDSPSVQSCARGVYYRVAGDTLRVEVSTDAGRSYTTAWEVAGTAYAQIVRTYPALGDPAAHLASRSLVLHLVTDGYVVFVANGRDGLLYRDAPTPPLITDRPARLPRYVVSLVVPGRSRAGRVLRSVAGGAGRCPLVAHK